MLSIAIRSGGTMAFPAIAALVSGALTVTAITASAASAKRVPQRPTLTEFVAEANVNDQTLYLDGAHHELTGARCQARGLRYPGPDYSDRWNYTAQYFRCSVLVRFFENGGYNDRRVQVWATVMRAFRVRVGLDQPPALAVPLPYSDGYQYCQEVSVSDIQLVYGLPRSWRLARTAEAVANKILASAKSRKAFTRGCVAGAAAH